MGDHHADRDLLDHGDFDLDAPGPSLWKRLLEEDEDEPVLADDPRIPPLISREAVPKRLLQLYRDVIQSPPGTLSVVSVTMGVGKSDRAAKAALQTKIPWVFIVPTHAIADEYEKWLGPAAADVFIRRSITGLRIDGKPACLQHRRALRLIQVGVDPKRVCSGCQHMNDYAGTKLPCPALASSTIEQGRQRIAIFQAARADAVIEDLLDRYLPPIAETGGAPGIPDQSPLLVLDDPPAKILTLPVRQSLVGAVHRYMANLRPAVSVAIGGVVAPVLDALTDGQISSGASLYDILKAKYASEDAVRDALKGAWGCRQARLSAAAEKAFVSRSAGSDPELEASADAVGFLTIVREAAFEPRRPFFYAHSDGSQCLVSRAPWVRLLRRWLLLGGRALVLDATADIYVHRGAFGIETRTASEFSRLGISAKRGLKVNVTELHVADNATVNRLFVSWGSGAKMNHVRDGHARAKEFQGVLRHLAGLVTEHGGPVGILTDKPVAADLKTEIDRLRKDPSYVSELLPQDLVRHVRAGVEFRVGWYGNHRGQNQWKGVAVHATIGDPNPHLGTVFAEAMALGANPHARLQRLREAERDQAAGRARPIWGSPRMIVHYGRHRPVARWAPQWNDVETVKLTEGRPPVAPPDGRSWEEHERIRAERGLSKRAYAAEVGVKIATYIKWTAS